MPDLKNLAPDLEGDLDDLCRRTGVPLRTLERARAVLALHGVAGLAALAPVRATPELQTFHSQQITGWLRRELTGLPLEVRTARNRHTLLLSGRECLQLRFLPEASRWVLFRKRQQTWWPLPPGRPCLSLTDWLGQVRQVLTGVSSRQQA